LNSRLIRALRPWPYGWSLSFWMTRNLPGRIRKSPSSKFSFSVKGANVVIRNQLRTVAAREASAFRSFAFFRWSCQFTVPSRAEILDSDDSTVCFLKGKMWPQLHKTSLVTHLSVSSCSHFWPGFVRSYYESYRRTPVAEPGRGVKNPLFM